MTKTEDLRRLIVQQLNATEGQTYYRIAPDDAALPYKVFDLGRINLGDLARDDITLTVDIYDVARNPKRIDAIADELEDALNAANLPQETILPTFFRDARYTVPDSDKTIQHLQLTFLVQLYTND